MKKYCSRAGMSMIELVSALTIFLFILGALTMALNKATTLWSSSHTNQYEKEKANHILTLIADDLQLAVTDNGLLENINSEIPVTFYSDATTNQAAGGNTKMLLQFVKYRTKASPFDTTPDAAPALDAVFYTFAEDSLFRHVIPLKYSNPADPEHIGNLLKDLRPLVESSALPRSLLDYLKDPLNGTEPTVDWEYSLLADKLIQPVIITGIPTTYAIKDKSNLISTPANPQTLQSVPEYNKIESTVLPDYIDISIRIFNEADWFKYVNLFNTSVDDETFARLQKNLGTYSSRRISFRTTRGARLP